MFKDYPTRQRIGEAFLPCLLQALGHVSESAPPFDYDWGAKAGTPRIHLGPQSLTVFIASDTTQAGFGSVMRVLGVCGG